MLPLISASPHALRQGLLSREVTSKTISLTPNLTFPEKGGEIVRVFNHLSPNIPFDQVIASWNVQPADTGSLKIQVRAHGSGLTTGWYTLGIWSLDNKISSRESLKGQSDSFGRVDTDTLILMKSAESADLKLTLNTVDSGVASVLKFVTLNFSGPPATEPAESGNLAWGKLIEVPKRAQSAYPGGADSWCSPTSLSMMLAHWSQVLKRPEVDQDVPEVQAHVFDSVYRGAGNWPFNTAYAGSIAGIRAYVDRFNSIEDAEKWIAAGYPVACSVAYSLALGRPLSPTESGHLMVLVGFTPQGDPIFNDPAHRDGVVRSLKREDFMKGWDYSRRTVYLVYPEGEAVPELPSVPQ